MCNGLQVQRVQRVTFRDLKRMDGKTRSPVLNHMTSSIQGLHSIIAYGKQSQETDRLVVDFTHLHNYLDDMTYFQVIHLIKTDSKES